MKSIHVLDESGASVLRYIVIVENDYWSFYGGNTCDGGPDHGPHVMHTPATLLDLIAQLAIAKDAYTLQSNISGITVRLRPMMMANEIASVLGIDVEEVLDRYSLLVRPVPEGYGVCSVCGIVPADPEGRGCTHGGHD